MYQNNKNFKNSIRVAFMNIRGQSGLKVDKQIEAFMKRNKCDILHLQEVNIDSDSFSTCDFISDNFNIFTNNSSNKYGTASLVRSEFLVENICCDTEGRVLI